MFGASGLGEVGVWGSSAAWPRPTSAPHPQLRGDGGGGDDARRLPPPCTPRTSHLRYVRRMCFADSDVVSCAHSNEMTCFALGPMRLHGI